jgi:glycine oxidase
MQNRVTDYIIVGQGLAGSVLAHLLLQKGKSVLVIDHDEIPSSSSIAAGLINPITGWRFVKTWLIDELIPEAKSVYQDLEELLNIPLWNERIMVRALKNIEEENQWILKSSYEDYQNYCSKTIFSGYYPTLSHQLKHFRSFAEIKQCIQVDVPTLIQKYRAYLVENKLIINESFCYEDLIIDDQGVTYKDFEAKKIIFCEGAKAVNNPYFNYLPFNLDKGELLIVRIPNLNQTEKIIKNIISIVPIGDDTYWVGATNEWNYQDELPSQLKKADLIAELDYILHIPYQIIDHQAGIRPTVKDRRPFIGSHPEHQTLSIFNGMGTKGTSLVPFFAKHFVDHLTNNEPLDISIDIKRFVGCR